MAGLRFGYFKLIKLITMKKTITLFGLLLFLFMQIQAQQRTVAECTVNYILTADSSGNAADNLSATKKVVYIKGNDSRVDFASPSFSQTIFYDKNSGNAIVLRDIGNNKLMTKFSKTQWIDKNKKADGANINFLTDTKTILGYECKKAIVQPKEGVAFTVFYATAIIPSVKEFEYQFKDIPGLVLEYETEENGKKLRFTASKINLNPVSVSKFDVPTAGYRLIN